MTLYTSMAPPSGPLDSVRAEYIENRLSPVLFDTLKPLFEDTPSRKEQLTVPQRLYADILQAVWGFLETMGIYHDELSLNQRHLRVWTDQNFGTLHKARRSILRMTVFPLSDTPDTSYELGNMISGFFSNIHIGPDEVWTSSTDYDRVRAAIESCIKRIPSVNLMNKFRGASDSEYKLVIDYFGADYLSALLQCNYFDSFKTMSDLVEYIKEDTAELRFTQSDVYRTAALCLYTTRDSLYQAIMSSCSSDLRFILGFGDNNPTSSIPYGVDIFATLDDIRALKGGISYAYDEREFISFKEFPYEDTDKFYEYVQVMIKTQSEQSSIKESYEWWRHVHALMARNFEEVDELKYFLEWNQIHNWKSARVFFQRLARWYLRTKQPKVQRKIKPSPSKGKIHNVYTDGSVINEKAGAGVYFGQNHPDNLSTRLQASFSTPQQAELGAILLALETIQRRPKHTYILYTDSHYSLKSLTEWHKKWKTNNWTSCKGEPVANRDLIELVLKKLAKTPNVTLQLVKGHSGNEGNVAADKLARDALA